MEKAYARRDGICGRLSGAKRLAARRAVVFFISFLSLSLPSAAWAGTTLGEGLAGHWKLNGNLEDSSGRGNFGLWEGEWANALEENFVEGVPGSGGRALRFDGGPDEGGPVTHERIVFGIEDSHTVTMWQRLPEDETHWNSMLGTGIHGTGGYWLYRGSILRKYHCYDRDEGKGILFNFGLRMGRQIPVEDWFHLAIITSPADLEEREVNYRIYVNGDLVRDRNMRWHPRVENFTYKHIGGNGGSRKSDIFAGLIDDVRIYDRALGKDEIKQLAGLWK